MWYDINKTLSYNKLFNFVIGPRGVGKTYAAKKRAIQNWIKKGHQFVYLRRYDTEIKQSKINNLFLDVGCEYPEHEITSKFGGFYMDDKIFGWALSLSKAGQIKSIPFPNVSMIVFDEFIIDQGMIRYLPNEVHSFLEMYSTISRLRDVPVVFLSNAITFTNPYFIYFDIEEPKSKKKVRIKGDILIQYVEDEEYSAAASDTRFGKLIADTQYARYAEENEFLRDNDKFIEPLPDGMNCNARLRIDDQEFGLYSKGLSKWYISDKIDPTCQRVVAYSNFDHDETTKLKNSFEASPLWARLQEMYYAGNLRFTSLRAKNIVSSKLINVWR